jgi:alkyl sulfatase BDS1-like metallo-beta-lactamase superfamily hydrolase
VTSNTGLRAHISGHYDNACEGTGRVRSLSVNTEPKDPTIATKAFNAQFEKMLPFTDRQDLEDAKRGFIAELPNGDFLDESWS